VSLREKIIAQLNDGIVEMAHEIFLAMVKPYTAEQVKEFVRTDTDPWGELEGPMLSTGALQFVRKIFRAYQNECLKWITFDQTLIQIQQHREDLWPVVTTYRGRTWLRKRVDILREIISGVRPGV
jgi:hypothetical protein